MTRTIYVVAIVAYLAADALEMLAQGRLLDCALDIILAAVITFQHTEDRHG